VVRAVEKFAYALRLKRRPAFHRTRDDVLRSLPVRNSLVKWTKEESGEVSLVIPVAQKKHLQLLVRWMKLPDKRVVSLDEVGSYVWERCDGQTSFERIAEELAERFRLTRREAEASLAEFLRILGRRGMIGIVIPGAALAKEDAARRPKRRPERSTQRQKKKGTGRG